MVGGRSSKEHEIANTTGDAVEGHHERYCSHYTQQYSSRNSYCCTAVRWDIVEEREQPMTTKTAWGNARQGMSQEVGKRAYSH